MGELYTGNLYTLPLTILPPPFLTTLIDSLSLEGKTTPVKKSFILDSASGYTYLPLPALLPIFESLGINHTPGTFLKTDCTLANDQRVIEFKLCYYQYQNFGPPVDLILNGLQSYDVSKGVYTLGDSFLRSVYLVYDVHNLQVLIAQSNHLAVATDSNIRVIPSGKGVIPGAMKCPSSF